MIITLRNADFSQSNIGTLSSWRVACSLGAGATYNGALSVDKGASFTAIVTLAEGYEIGNAGVIVTMGGTVLSGVHSITDHVVTINIPEVTGNVLIKVPTVVSSITTTTITDLSGYEKHQGLISSTGAWNNINEKYQHVVVPVSGYTTLDITTTTEHALYFAGLQTYETPINGVMPVYSSDETWSTRMSCPKDTQRAWAVPSDVRYLVFCIINNTQDVTPVSISIVTGG